MTLRHPGNHWHRTLLMFCAALLAACGSSTSDALDPDAFGAKFKLSDNQIPGWKQDTRPAALAVLTADHLTDKIDGAAPDYVSRGCRLAMYQSLVGPDPEVCTLVAMDFGTDAQATSMVVYEQQLTSAQIQVPPYDAATAIASEVLGGITVYAHFKSTYFEVQLGGFSDQSSAVKVAATFLAVLKVKAGS